MTTNGPYNRIFDTWLTPTVNQTNVMCMFHFMFNFNLLPLDFWEKGISILLPVKRDYDQHQILKWFSISGPNICFAC